MTSWYITVSILYGNLENTHQGTVPHHTSYTLLELFLLFLVQNCEYSPEDANGQWLPTFTSSCITHFCATQGLPTGWCGWGRLPALLSSSAQGKFGRLSESFWSHTESREGSCLEQSCIRNKNIFCQLQCLVLYQVILYHLVLLSQHNPYICYSPVWFLALWPFQVHYTCYHLLVEDAYLSVCVKSVYLSRPLMSSHLYL